MKKNKKVIVVIITITIILLIFLAGYSFSKYSTKIDGDGVGQIAEWYFGMGDIKEIFLKDTINEVSLVPGKIAPGTKGNFDIVIDATGSEVEVDYHVNVLSETNLPTNMKYYINKEDGSVSGEYNSLRELSDSELKGKISINGDQRKVITINWKWPYETEDISQIEEYDSLDWYDGTKPDLEYKFVLQIIGTQSKNA